VGRASFQYYTGIQIQLWRRKWAHSVSGEAGWAFETVSKWTVSRNTCSSRMARWLPESLHEWKPKPYLERWFIRSEFGKLCFNFTIVSPVKCVHWMITKRKHWQLVEKRATFGMPECECAGWTGRLIETVFSVWSISCNSHWECDSNWRFPFQHLESWDSLQPQNTGEPI